MLGIRQEEGKKKVHSAVGLPVFEMHESSKNGYDCGADETQLEQRPRTNVGLKPIISARSQ